ncbi:3-deoxy-8-phosphooctulonate synthase [Curvivirga aplysinae]|uniref:3-deoxy-8-phosphooctulonate synthase n=1 Tax=Curvivirga aplysinae TaxID=2529852 RepID=UPI0012BB9C5A|nr:3-deoxy-8-phosphooctulonate synthase [Curvivirga aplysinae]MTI08668.1 3-deoxy-8-phosphooctulonate synthase [Curvivirga aplysinae]
MTAPHHIKLGDITIGNDLPFVLFAGPCQMESREHAFDMAGKLKEITDKLNIGFVYKSSFDKANRTSLNTKRGLGLDTALNIFSDIKKELDVPVLTDVHEASQCAEVADVIDIIQIPAFLCRQTDLLIAAAQTGKIINVKKGQFLAPWDMKNVLDKVIQSGNSNVMACDRGTSFGYNTLVTDFRGLPEMARTGQPVVFDATHSVQQPGGQGGTSGGQRQFVPVLARAAMAVGVAAVFMETHQDPDNAPSDGPNMVPVDQMEELLSIMKQFDTITKSNLVYIG